MPMLRRTGLSRLVWWQGMDPSTHLAFRDSAALNLQRLEQANGNGALGKWGLSTTAAGVRVKNVHCKYQRALERP